MDEFINESKDIKLEELNSYIDRRFLEQVLKINYYNRTLELKVVFPSSLNNGLECSDTTLGQVHYELGYEALLDYIELLKNPNLLSSYLSTSSKQLIAMHYFLYKTDHHSKKTFKRNITSNNLYEQMETNIKNSVEEITSTKSDYIEFMNEEKDKFNTWYNESDNKYNDFMNNGARTFSNFLKNCKTKMNSLEKTYSEKLKVSKPAEFMLEKAEEYEEKTKYWIKIDIAVAIIFLILLALILNPKIEFTKKIITVNLFGGEMPVYSSIIILSMICLIIYVLRVLIKVTMSSKHLSEEYK